MTHKEMVESFREMERVLKTMDPDYKIVKTAAEMARFLRAFFEVLEPLSYKAELYDKLLSSEHSA